MMIFNVLTGTVLASALMFSGVQAQTPTAQEKVEVKTQITMPVEINNDTYTDIVEVSMKKTDEKEYTTIFSDTKSPIRMDSERMMLEMPFTEKDVVDIRIKDSNGNVTEFTGNDLSSFVDYEDKDYDDDYDMEDYYEHDFEGSKVSIEFEQNGNSIVCHRG